MLLYLLIVCSSYLLQRLFTPGFSNSLSIYLYESAMPDGQNKTGPHYYNLIAKLSAGLYCTFTLANCRQIHTLLLLWQGPVMSRARRRKVGIVDYRLVRTVVGQLWTAPESCPRLFHDGTAGHP